MQISSEYVKVHIIIWAPNLIIGPNTMICGDSSLFHCSLLYDIDFQSWQTNVSRDT